jgi:hypothetical protein
MTDSSINELRDLFRNLQVEIMVRLASVDAKLEKLVESDSRIEKTLNDHESRIRNIETTKKDRLHPSLLSGLVAAGVSAVGVVAGIAFK